MALIKCSECGEQVSSAAKVCPHFVVRTGITFRVWFVVIGLIAALTAGSWLGVL